jgi:hypothetical protein
MSAVKIVLEHPHIEVEDGVIQYCVGYRLTNPVGGVIDGEVGYEPAPGATADDILAELCVMAADHANLQTANVEAFTTADVITWEARA